MYITPCMSVCKIVEGICVGCGRTKEEICMWMQMDDNERMTVMQRLGYGKRKCSVFKRNTRK